MCYGVSNIIICLHARTPLFNMVESFFEFENILHRPPNKLKIVSTSSKDQTLV